MFSDTEKKLLLRGARITRFLFCVHFSFSLTFSVLVPLFPVISILNLLLTLGCTQNDEFSLGDFIIIIIP